MGVCWVFLLGLLPSSSKSSPSSGSLPPLLVKFGTAGKKGKSCSCSSSAGLRCLVTNVDGKGQKRFLQSSSSSWDWDSQFLAALHPPKFHIKTKRVGEREHRFYPGVCSLSPHLAFTLNFLNPNSGNNCSPYKQEQPWGFRDGIPTLVGAVLSSMPSFSPLHHENQMELWELL